MRNLGRRIGDDHPGHFKRPAFRRIASAIAGHDGAGVAHLLAGRRSGAGNEGGNRFAHRPGVVGGVFFHRAANFADDDDGLGCRVVVKRGERVARGGAEHRVAPDADEG